MSPTTRRLVSTAAALLLLVVGTACSGDDDPPTPGSREPATTAPEAIPSTVKVGQVAGRIPQPRRKQVVAAVAEVVDGWIDAAFVGGEWPREVTDAYPGFTKRAAQRAAKQPRITSAAGFSDRVEAVSATKRVVHVDLVNTGGRARGATARVVLDLDTTGEVEQQVRVRGRLFLTRVDGNWKIFGYDLTQGVR